MTPLLASVALKGLLVLLIAALASRLLRKAPASARHGVWAAAFAALLVLPALALVGPQWTVGVLPAQVASVAPMVAPTPPTPPAPPSAVALAPMAGVADRDAMEAEMAAFEAEVAAFERHVEAEVAHEMAAFEHEMEAFAAEMEALAAERDAVVTSDAEWVTLAATSRGLPPLGRWALGLWALGAIAVALSWVGATLAARRIVADATPETDADWNVLAERARRLSGIEGPVRLLRTDALDVPIAWGWGTPAVLLPASADEWGEGRREAVLLHEMAHLRRHDAWTQVVAQAALAVHWLNPLAWWGYRRFLDAREQACDDAVIQGGARPSDYAAHLVGVARALRREPHALAAVAPMARTACPLEERIVSILDADRRRGHLGRVTRAATAVLAAAVILPLAALQPVAQTSDASTLVAEAPAPPTPPSAPEAPATPIAPTLSAEAFTAPTLADTTDEEFRRATAELESARRELRRTIREMRSDEDEVEAIRREALQAALEGLESIDLQEVRQEMRQSRRIAAEALAEVDMEAVRRDMERALRQTELSVVERERIQRDVRRALDEVHIELDGLDMDDLHDVIEDAMDSVEIEIEGIDMDRIRVDLRRALDAAEAEEATLRSGQYELRLELDEAARERREALREVEQELRQAQREIEREAEEARREVQRERRDAQREVERARRDAERERRTRRDRGWAPSPKPTPNPAPAPTSVWVPGPSTPPGVVAPRAVPRTPVVTIKRRSC